MKDSVKKPEDSSRILIPTDTCFTKGGKSAFDSYYPRGMANGSLLYKSPYYSFRAEISCSMLTVFIKGFKGIVEGAVYYCIMVFVFHVTVVYFQSFRYVFLQ